MHPGRENLEKIRTRIVSLMIQRIGEAKDDATSSNLVEYYNEIYGISQVCGIVQEAIIEWEKDDARLKENSRKHGFPFPLPHPTVPPTASIESAIPSRFREFLEPHDALGPFLCNFQNRPINYEKMATTTFWNDCPEVAYFTCAFLWEGSPQGHDFWEKLNAEWESLFHNEDGTHKKD